MESETKLNKRLRVQTNNARDEHPNPKVKISTLKNFFLTTNVRVIVFIRNISYEI